MQLGVALATLTGCQPRIGDPCTNSRDCGRTIDRLCDLSKRIDGQGECTIDGCGRGMCPERSTCVQTYASEFLSTACDRAREDRATCAIELETDETCPADEVLPPLDDCRPTEICLPEGRCADELTARTSCRRECKDDDDCGRDEYVCRWTGSRGVYRAPDPERPGDTSQVRYCAPRT